MYVSLRDRQLGGMAHSLETLLPHVSRSLFVLVVPSLIQPTYCTCVVTAKIQLDPASEEA